MATAAPTRGRDRRWLGRTVGASLAMAAAVALAGRVNHNRRGAARVTAAAGAGGIERVSRAGGGDGGLTRCDAGGRSCVPARGGEELAPGARLRTDEATRAFLRLPTERSSPSIGRRRIVFGAAGRRAQLVRGAVAADVAHLASGTARFELPQGRAEVLGTKFALRADDAWTSVDVSRGAVRLEDGRARSITVRAGEEGRIFSELPLDVGAAPDLGETLVWGEATGQPEEGTTARGLGELRAKKPGTDRELDRAVRLSTHAVKVRIAGAVARTEIDEVFTNDTGDVLEGIYRFPLPPDAKIERLALEVDGRMVEGAFVDRDRAAAIWRGAIVHAAPHAPKPKEEIIWVPGPWRDPALLEWQRGGRFELRIFRSRATDRAASCSRTRRRSARRAACAATPIRWRTIRRGRRASIASTSTCRCAATIPSWACALTAIRCSAAGRPTMARRRSPGRRAASCRAATCRSCPACRPRRRAVGLGVPRGGRRPIAGDVGGRQLRRDRAAAAAAAGRGERAARLRAGRRFQPVDVRRDLAARDPARDAVHERAGFGRPRDGAGLRQPCRALPGGFVVPGPETSARIGKFLAAITPDGASDVAGAIAAAAAAGGKNGGALRLIYFGDGAPTMGPVRPASVTRAVTQALPAGRGTVTAVAIGPESDLQMLGALARGGGGVVLPHVPGQTTAEAAFAVLGATYGSALRDVTLTLPEELHEVAPRKLDTIAAGSEAFVVARLAGAEAAGTIVLRGKLGARDFEQRYPVRIVASSGAGNAFVPRLYAAVRIADLERDDAPEAKQRTLELSRRFAVASRFTSLLVLESQAMFRAFGLDNTRTTPEWTGEEASEGTTSDGEIAVAGEGGKAGKATAHRALPPVKGKRDMLDSPLDGFSSGRGRRLEGGRAGGRGGTVSKPATSDRLMSRATPKGGHAKTVYDFEDDELPPPVDPQAAERERLQRIEQEAEARRKQQELARRRPPSAGRATAA